MYSKAKGIIDQTPAVPPGYRGNRFSDSIVGEAPERVKMRDAPRRASDPLDFLKTVNREEQLLIALIIVLAEEGRADGESIIMLILLLLLR